MIIRRVQSAFARPTADRRDVRGKALVPAQHDVMNKYRIMKVRIFYINGNRVSVCVLL